MVGRENERRLRVCPIFEISSEGQEVEQKQDRYTGWGRDRDGEFSVRPNCVAQYGSH